MVLSSRGRVVIESVYSSFFFPKLDFIFVLCVFFWPMRKCITMCVCLMPFGNQKKSSNPLELEFWVTMSHHVGSGN